MAKGEREDGNAPGAAARGRGGAELRASPDELVQDGAHELLLALQHRTGAAESAARGGQPERRGEDDRPRAAGATEASGNAAAAASERMAEQPAGQKAPGGDYDAFDCEESLMAAQTLSGLAQLEARKVVAEKKERKNFAKDAVEELKKWFASHLDHPYPDEEDKEELARKTNLNVAQVSYWFVNARKRIWQPLLHEKHAGTLTGYAKVTAADMLRSGAGSGTATGARAGEKAVVKLAGQAGAARAAGSLSATSALSALCGVAAACLAPLAAAEAAAADGAGVRCQDSSAAETQEVDAAAALSVLKMHGAAGVMLGAASSADKPSARSIKQSSGVLPHADAGLEGLVSGPSPHGARAMQQSESAAERGEVSGKGAKSAGRGGGEGRGDVVGADDKAREVGSGGGGGNAKAKTLPPEAKTCPDLRRAVAGEKVVKREDGRKRERESETNNVRDKVRGEMQEVRGGGGGKRQVRRKEAIAT